MNLKKQIAGMLVLSLAILCVKDVPVYAASKVIPKEEETQTTKSMQESLTDVLLKVKQRVDIPAECTDFHYDYYDDYTGHFIWSLDWTDKKQNRTINISADDNANIIEYYDYQYGIDKQEELKYLKSELTKDALKAVERLNPSFTDHLQLVSGTYTSIYQNAYSFTYARVENGLLMPDNTVMVTISANDKSIKRYSCNWLFNEKIPSADTKITKETAKDKISNITKMTLEYRNCYSAEQDGKRKLKAFLAYVPSNTYVAVNAKTGEVYTTKEEWRSANMYDEKGTTSYGIAQNTKADEVELTPEEISKIDEMSGLLSKDAAIKLIQNNQLLWLDPAAKSVTASLCQRYNYDDTEKKTYLWDIKFIDPRERDEQANDTYRAYAYAVINAATGEILSYRSSVKTADYDNYVTAAEAHKFTQAKCKENLEKFIKSQNKDHFAAAQLTDTKEDDYVITYKEPENLYAGVSYTYSRMNEGVPYSYNYFKGSVDTATGKIYNYDYNWTDDITFESPKKAMDAKAAMKAYLNLPEFDLIYESNTIHNYNEQGYKVNTEVRLVYSTEGIENQMISPFTGKQIDYNGEEYKAVEPENQEYNDIKGNPYERSILLLSDIGLGYESASFAPNKNITTQEIIKFAQAAGFYSNEEKDKIFNELYVTKQAACSYLMKLMNIDYIAQLKGIFTCGYADDNSIAENCKGAVAITKGLGLLGADQDSKFNPERKLTRGEAADLFIKLVNYQFTSKRYY